VNPLVVLARLSNLDKSPEVRFARIGQPPHIYGQPLNANLANMLPMPPRPALRNRGFRIMITAHEAACTAAPARTEFCNEQPA
jgi:hypothetical protein